MGRQAVSSGLPAHQECVVSSGKVVVVGIVCADIIARPVNGIPERGLLVPIERLELHTGGCATNAGIDLARLGIACSVLGKVGRDGFGDFVVHTLEQEGVDTKGLRRADGVQTAATVVLVGHDGERSFLHCLGANATFVSEDVDMELVRSADVLVVAGSLLMPKLDGEPTAEVLRGARECGVVTLLDTAWDASGRWMKSIETCLPFCDYFLPSEAEAAMLSGVSEPEAMAASFVAQGARNVIIKLGDRGCLLQTEDGVTKHVAALAVSAVDTTGAGDAFVAGFTAGLVHGWDASRCAHLAVTVGAMCVTVTGASSGVRSFAETVQVMERGGLM
jgi:sugar/nucleoside kinase (ribokinase family)